MQNTITNSPSLSHCDALEKKASPSKHPSYYSPLNTTYKKEEQKNNGLLTDNLPGKIVKLSDNQAHVKSLIEDRKDKELSRGTHSVLQTVTPIQSEYTPPQKNSTEDYKNATMYEHSSKYKLSPEKSKAIKNEAIEPTQAKRLQYRYQSLENNSHQNPLIENRFSAKLQEQKEEEKNPDKKKFELPLQKSSKPIIKTEEKKVVSEHKIYTEKPMFIPQNETLPERPKHEIHKEVPKQQIVSPSKKEDLKVNQDSPKNNHTIEELRKKIEQLRNYNQNKPANIHTNNNQITPQENHSKSPGTIKNQAQPIHAEIPKIPTTKINTPEIPKPEIPKPPIKPIEEPPKDPPAPSPPKPIPAETINVRKSLTAPRGINNCGNSCIF